MRKRKSADERHWTDRVESPELRERAKRREGQVGDTTLRTLTAIFDKGGLATASYAPEAQQAVAEGRELNARLDAERAARDREFKRTHDRYGNVMPASRTRA
jgi:dihydroxyacetone kinase